MFGKVARVRGDALFPGELTSSSGTYSPLSEESSVAGGFATQ
jgi:hypothetical protein